MDIAEKPLFDSSRAALRFALSDREIDIRPVMNRMMSAGRLVLKTLKSVTDGTDEVRRFIPPRDQQLIGLDGKAMGGMILQLLGKLPEIQQSVLKAGSMHAMMSCTCRSPCCAGEKPNKEWAVCILYICDHLKNEAELTKVKGKKGLSTSPLLRRALVEKQFLPNRRLVLSELADACHISEQTVHNHRKPIVAFLEKQETDGWRSFDEYLAESGIVGFIE